MILDIEMMLLAILIAIQIVLSDSVKVFKSDVKLEDEGKYLSGAHLVNEIGNITLGYLDFRQLFLQ